MSLPHAAIAPIIGTLNHPNKRGAYDTLLHRFAQTSKTIRKHVPKTARRRYKLAEESRKYGNGYHPLHLAALNGNAEVLNAILRRTNRGQELKNSNAGKTALHLAAEHGHVDAVKKLLHHGPTANQRDSKNQTPLMYAAKKGHIRVANALLKKAKTNVKDAEERTALFHAVDSGNAKMVNLLINKGAKVNVRMLQEGSTPLHYAVSEGYPNVVAALLRHGANRHARTRPVWGDGETPLEIAWKKFSEASSPSLKNRYSKIIHILS